MVSHHLHGSTTAILHLSMVLWFCCCLCPCRGKRPSECDPPTSENPMSFLWSVRRNPPSYFFGTIHVPYSRVWDYIPENTKRAFELAENIFFELDLTDPYTISALTNCQLLPHGESLSDVLPRDIYRRLKRHLDYVKGMMPVWMTSDQRGRGLYADYLFNAITGNWERKRPVWVMLMVNSLTESDIRSRGIPVLDLYLAQQAERLNKPSGAVERVEEQCVPLNGLNVSQVLFALNQTLFQHESIRAGNTQVLYTTDDLIKHYNCGDLNAVIFNQDAAQVPNLINASLPLIDQITARKIDDYFKDELIFKRNKRMGERVIQLLLSHPEKSFFFAFGAGHFLGNNTVLDMLRDAGFSIDHIPADRRIKSMKRRLRGPIGLLPEFRALRDFSLASNSLDDQSSEERTYVHISHNPRKRMHKKLMPPRSASAPPHRKHRNFNDLWVRLDPATTRDNIVHHHDVVKDTVRRPEIVKGVGTMTKRPVTSLNAQSHLQMALKNKIKGDTNRAPSLNCTPLSMPQHTENEDSLIVQRSLRVWYGLPTNSAIAVCSFAWNIWMLVVTMTTLSLYTLWFPVIVSCSE